MSFAWMSKNCAPDRCPFARPIEPLHRRVLTRRDMRSSLRDSIICPTRYSSCAGIQIVNPDNGSGYRGRRHRELQCGVGRVIASIAESPRSPPLSGDPSRPSLHPGSDRRRGLRDRRISRPTEPSSDDTAQSLASMSHRRQGRCQWREYLNRGVARLSFVPPCKAGGDPRSPDRIRRGHGTDTSAEGVGTESDRTAESVRATRRTTKRRKQSRW